MIQDKTLQIWFQKFNRNLFVKEREHLEHPASTGLWREVFPGFTRQVLSEAAAAVV